MSYLERIRGPQSSNVVPISASGPRRALEDGAHPYAAAIRDAWVDRLTALAGRAWQQGDAWDTNCFVTARKLIELANSPWSGYAHTDARADYFAHAPYDHAWDEREKCWNQAEKAAAGVALPEPPPREDLVIPSTTVLDDEVAAEIAARIAQDLETDADPLARFNLIDWAQLKHEEDKGEEWIVEPLVSAGRMVALYSAPKAGKSLLVLELVAAVALGLPTLGRPAQPPVPVLYVDFENDPRGDIKPRLEDMGHDLEDLAGRLHIATFPSMARLDTPQGGQELLWLAEQLGARLVVIDTVSRTVGGEENDNNTWLSFYRNTGVPLKRAGIACVRLDHTGKDRERGMRGGSAKYGDVDAVWRLAAASETVLELTCTDHRMALDTTEFTLVRRTDPLRHEVSGTPFVTAMDAKERRLADLLDRLQVPTDWGRDKVRKALIDAGETAENTLLSRVIKARKLTPTHLSADRSRTGADSQPPDRLSGTPHRGPDGGQVGPVRNGQGQVDDQPVSLKDQMVSCSKCYRPTTRGVAEQHDGLCESCAATTTEGR